MYTTFLNAFIESLKAPIKQLAITFLSTLSAVKRPSSSAIRIQSYPLGKEKAWISVTADFDYVVNSGIIS